MTVVTRRQLLSLGSLTLASSIVFPSGKRISAEQQLQLSDALGKSMEAGWKLFHTTNATQVLYTGQALLQVLQQVQTNLSSHEQGIFYSYVYRLIGGSLYLKGQHNKSYQAHEKAFLAASENTDLWNMAQSLSWQGYVLQEKMRYADAIQTADTALQLISQQSDIESLRLQARLQAFIAEIATLTGNVAEGERRLHVSEALLDYLPGIHEEFDRGCWLQQAGGCALNVGHYTLAIEYLQQALDETPLQWVLRYVSTTLLLAKAFASIKEPQKSIALTRKILPVIKSVQIEALTKDFMGYLQKDIIANFSDDKYCQDFVSEVHNLLAL